MSCFQSLGEHFFFFEPVQGLLGVLHHGICSVTKCKKASPLKEDFKRALVDACMDFSPSQVLHHLGAGKGRHLDSPLFPTSADLLPAHIITQWHSPLDVTKSSHIFFMEEDVYLYGSMSFHIENIVILNRDNWLFCNQSNFFSESKY